MNRDERVFHVELRWNVLSRLGVAESDGQTAVFETTCFVYTSGKILLISYATSSSGGVKIPAKRASFRANTSKL